MSSVSSGPHVLRLFRLSQRRLHAPLCCTSTAVGDVLVWRLFLVFLPSRVKLYADSDMVCAFFRKSHRNKGILCLVSLESLTAKNTYMCIFFENLVSKRAFFVGFFAGLTAKRIICFFLLSFFVVHLFLSLTRSPRRIFDPFCFSPNTKVESVRQAASRALVTLATDVSSVLVVALGSICQRVSDVLNNNRPSLAVRTHLLELLVSNVPPESLAIDLDQSIVRFLVVAVGC